MFDDDAKVTEAILKVLALPPIKPWAANDIEDYLVSYTHVFDHRNPRNVGRELPNMMKDGLVACYEDTYNHVLVWCLPELILSSPQYVRRFTTKPRTVKEEGGNLFA